MTEIPFPFRVSSTDNPVDILTFAASAMRRGGAALATLVEIRGGAARALGAQVAVAADGGFVGYVSGGCVEGAVAAEALHAIAEGRDRFVKFGEGSPFFDIILPCGGGITVSIHVLRGDEVLHTVLGDLNERRSVALAYSSRLHSFERCNTHMPTSGWQGEEFVSVYHPQTRLVISGQMGEAEAVRRLGEAAGYAVSLSDPQKLARAQSSVLIDPFTAVVLLHHDLDLEADLLNEALASSAFYIGALGSIRTHRRRVDRLVKTGVSLENCNRIKAPIGLFGPTRDATTLALSVLAEIAVARSTATSGLYVRERKS
ncbi:MULTISPECIES: XdhC family protein [Agrobacterium]|uniref:XdhC family protein n=1 Tax=Agrobacterium TaxID=357 RepID=UPI0022CB5BD2|nr:MULTISPECIES: XdhC family protein [Agrobacterium]MCZ7865483.1 XdhC family protein [Agrobacterium salinitolerans]MDA5639558.1 XdhC family protein [Agrobacterium sp. ST15.13.013]MDA6999547.1 XdhC family protein [Agrobacterium salinitolerans]